MPTDTVTASPEQFAGMPGMKASGTKTDSSTNVMATIGAVMPSIAFLVASFTESE